METAGARARRVLARGAACAVALAALGGLLAATGCSSAPEQHGSPIIQVVKGARDFPNRVEAGRVSLGYPDDLWVIAEPSAATSSALGREVETVQALVGDNDFSHGFAVGECGDLTLDEVREYAETAQELAPSRAEMLEEKARESEGTAQMFESFAQHYRRVVYGEPESVWIDGRRGIAWRVDVPYEDDAFVTRVHFVEVDGTSVGFVMSGFYQHEYDADPAFWDDIFASLEVR